MHGRLMTRTWNVSLPKRIARKAPGRWAGLSSKRMTRLRRLRSGVLSLSAQAGMEVRSALSRSFTGVRKFGRIFGPGFLGFRGFSIAYMGKWQKEYYMTYSIGSTGKAKRNLETHDGHPPLSPAMEGVGQYYFVTFPQMVARPRNDAAPRDKGLFYMNMVWMILDTCPKWEIGNMSHGLCTLMP